MRPALCAPEDRNEFTRRRRGQGAPRFALGGGGIVLVDRGFAPLAWKDNHGGDAQRPTPPWFDVEGRRVCWG
ncbi:MAG: hypothetical protein H6872_04610 [Methylobacteriaceae bacterium]|nr:hypothetical protein [Methylobacteriaceae bacterium]